MMTLFKKGQALVGIGGIAYVGWMVWIFGFGHAHEEPSSLLWVWSLFLSVLGPMAVGLIMMLIGLKREKP